MGSARRTKSFEVEQARRDSELAGKARLDATGVGLGYETTPRASIRTLGKTLINTTWKFPVRVATTTNSALATTFENADVIDGVTLATGDRILIKNQTAGSENGIYVVNATGAPTRASDFDDGFDSIAGVSVIVEEGTANADTFWFLTTNNPITLDTTSLTFTEISGGGGNEFVDNVFRIKDDIDDTRKLAFQVGGIAASTVRTWTVQNASGTVALLDSGVTQSASDAFDFNGNVDVIDANFTIEDDIDGTRKAKFQTGGISASTTRTMTIPNASGVIALIDGGGTQIFSNTNEFIDNNFLIRDDIDNTRKLAFQTGGIAASTTRTWTAQDVSGTVALLDGGATQTTANIWSFTNDVTLGNTNADRLTITALIDSLVSPDADGTRELGDSTHHWDDVFTETLTLRTSGGNTTGTIKAIHADSVAMILNVPVSDNFQLRFNNVVKYQFNSGTFDLEGQDIIDISNIEFRTPHVLPVPGFSTAAIWTDAGGMKLNVPTGDRFSFRINGAADDYAFSATVADFKTNNLQLGAGSNIILDASTGTKIGTATSQKLGFYNTTPVIQQTVGSDTLANLYTALRSVGIIG